MRTHMLSMLVFLLTLALVACDPGEQSDSAPIDASFEDLPAPAWRVVARRDGRVLLAAVRDIQPASPRAVDPPRAAPGEIAPRYPTLIYGDGQINDGPEATLALRVIGEGAAPDSLVLYTVPFAGAPVFFAQDGDLASQLIESPAEPGHYLYERRDQLWLIADSTITLLTADSVAGFSRDTLRTKTSEGGPLLYWATQPRWSPDGTLIAYVTNRSWMLSADGGQEIWTVDVNTLEERPLLSEAGAIFSTAGWLGDELLFTSRSERIEAISTRTGIRRSLGGDMVDGVSADGSKLLYSVGNADSLSMHVLSDGSVLDIPPPPAGERFDHGGSFAPNGNQLLLSTSVVADSGMTRALHLFELDAGRMTRIMQWNFRDGSRHPVGVPAWLDDSTLLLTEAGRGGGEARSRIVKLR